MCGVVGDIYSESKTSVDRSLGRLKKSLDTLAHRGPDDSGYESFLNSKWRINLGQTRLSIIDLSRGGHQPFMSRDGNFSLVFNGEIYNYIELRNYLIGSGYSFRTDSDTEVLLNAWIHWGAKCLPKLKGMFAFAVYEKSNNSLTLARDAFGIKPLFYKYNKESFSFASEVNALKKVSSSKILQNDQTIFNYLAFNLYDNTNESFFEGIKRLAPGHLLTIDISSSYISTNLFRWWWPEIVENRSISRLEAAEKIRWMFLDNVRKHLRSDVPIGVALSGGLDSSAIVCSIRRLEPEMEINTFSFISQGTTKNEELWIDRINNFVGATPHKVIVSPGDLARDLDDIIKSQGEPFGDTSIYAQYRVYKSAKDFGIKVTLDGQGADELFAGYFGYPEWRIRSLLSAGDIPHAISFLLKWRREPGRSGRDALMDTFAINVPKFLIPLAYNLSSRVFVNNFFHLENVDFRHLNDSYPLRALHQIGWRRALAGKLRDSLTGCDLSRLLRYGDRNSMRWSVESRVPFLTTDLAEFALSLPENYLVTQEGLTKDIFRKAMKGIVPDQITNRRDKVGFETPGHFWLTDLQGGVDNWLESLRELPWINIDTSKKYLHEVISGHQDFDWATWRIINVARWYALLVLD